MGSGSLPGQQLPTRLVWIAAGDAEALARRLRLHAPPVFARIQDDQVLIDPRTLLSEEEEAILIEALAHALRADQ
jgi:L-seryl-tRNA(Ser) seleniumtransferase